MKTGTEPIGGFHFKNVLIFLNRETIALRKSPIYLLGYRAIHWQACDAVSVMASGRRYRGSRQTRLCPRRISRPTEGEGFEQLGSGYLPGERTGHVSWIRHNDRVGRSSEFYGVRPERQKQIDYSFVFSAWHTRYMSDACTFIEIARSFLRERKSFPRKCAFRFTSLTRRTFVARERVPFDLTVKVVKIRKVTVLYILYTFFLSRNAVFLTYQQRVV